MIPDQPAGPGARAAGPAVGTGSGGGIGPAMTAATAPARHACLPARVSAELTWRLAQHTWRLGWDTAELAAHQRERLRVLLAYAAEYSPFHARRLRGLDLSRFEPGDLARLPVMTKTAMMAQFDNVVTDRRLQPPAGRAAPGRPGAHPRPAAG